MTLFDYGWSWTRWCFGPEWFSDGDEMGVGYFNLWLGPLRLTWWRGFQKKSEG